MKEMQSPSKWSLTEEALKENEDFDITIDPPTQPLQGETIDVQEDDARFTITPAASGYAGMDDTCFSTFSAVPNTEMTKFANLTSSPSRNGRSSPTKSIKVEHSFSRPPSRNTPSRNNWQNSDDECSPTPRRPQPHYDSGNDTTNLLVDFTDQFAVMPHSSRRSPQKQEGQSPKKSKFYSQPDLSLYSHRGRTPSPSKRPLPPSTPNEPHHLANLLDFDVSPAPTPRSIPTISARELEGMKSQFLSQISSLSASLNGRQAEIQSLKDAVTDAERRVGEAQEQIRDMRGAKEALEGEKADWENRQAEMQTVLKNVREEIIRGDREKDFLLQRAQEAEHKREEAEARLVEAESKIEGFKAGGATATPSTNSDGTQSETPSINASKEVEAAVNKVAKELHGLYRSKHETKVTALKKSYSDRWEKKVRELTTKVEDLSRENEDLRLGRDATMSGLVPGAHATNTPNANETIAAETAKREEAEAQLSSLETKLHSLESDLSTLRSTLTNSVSENQMLTTELEASRAETADLIAASEELMALSMQQLPPTTFSSSTYGTRLEDPSLPLGNSSSEGIQRSFSRSTSGSGPGAGSGSGLKAPGFGTSDTARGGSNESRIGRMGMMDSTGSGLGRSGILSNIEKMGRGRDRD